MAKVAFNVPHFRADKEAVQRETTGNISQFVANSYRQWRKVDRRGEDIHSAVLSDEDVREIREMYADGVMTQVQLAELFGVHKHTINKAIRRRTWTHL